MYQKEKNPWLKHLDFMLLDVVCLQLAYVMSYIIRYGMYIPYTDKNYRNLGIIIMLVQICLTFFLENYKDILRRSPFEEMKMTAVFVTSEVLAVFCYLFVTQTSRIFSRAVLLQFWVLGIVVIYFARLMRKRTIHRKMEDHRYLQSMILITPEKYAQEMILRSDGRKIFRILCKGDDPAGSGEQRKDDLRYSCRSRSRIDVRLSEGERCGRGIFILSGCVCHARANRGSVQ